MASQYRLAFRGEVAEGYRVEDVRAGFSKRLNKSDDVIDRLFSGKPVTLAKNLEWQRASDLAARLKSFGAVVYLVDENGNAVKVPDVANQDAVVQVPGEPGVAAPVENAEVAQVAEAAEVVHEAEEAEVAQAAEEADFADESVEAEPESSDAANDVETDPYDLTETAKVRHLTQITEPRPAKAMPPKKQRQARMRYRFDTFMAKGGASIFKVLTLVFFGTFLLIGLLRGALLMLFPEIPQQHEELDFFGNLYITFLEITDPGNMAQDIYSNVFYKVFAILAGLAGIVMLSALIAFITTALDQKIYELKRGRSKVIETDHTLILGWNEQRIIEILRELILANESEDDGCVVILADVDKEEMDDILRLRVPDLVTTRVVTRSGDVSSLTNLDMVSLESASSVIILASCEETESDELKASSDAKAIQTVLATMGNGVDDEEFSVIVEIFNPTHRDIVRSSFPEHVVTVNTSDILAKLLVQTSRSVGLSVVYNEILSFDGCEMYFYDTEWGGASFGEIGYRFPDGVPMGVRDADGRITMNPPRDHVLEPGDEILIVADDDSTIELVAEPVATPTDLELPDARQEPGRERELMIGWTFKSAAIVREFADYVIEGSEIDVMLKSPTDAQTREIEALDEELDDIHVNLLVKDCLDIDDLMSVRPFEYDNIIILAGTSSDDGATDASRVDSENIVAMLLLRRIFSQYPAESHNTKLITEILDSQNDELVAKAGVKDVIISNRLVSMIMAQISESRDIEKVYDDIFQEDGSEIYLKPAHLYFGALPAEASFADMMGLAQKRGEVCIGVKKKSLENSKDDNNGIQLIPEKSTRFELTAEDSLVVLSEDEL